MRDPQQLTPHSGIFRSRNRSISLLLVPLLSVCLGLSMSPAQAQETTGVIEGSILTDAGEPASQIEVTVSGASLRGTRTVRTNADGRFEFWKLPVGVFTVSAAEVGFQSITVESVSVHLGRTTTLGEFRLVPAADDQPEVLIVTAERMLDPVSTAMGDNISADEFNDLPLDRNYINIPTLFPQANQSFRGDGINFAGSTGDENKYFVDGVETTDPGFGRTGTRLPYNFVQEVEVKAGGYEAEYRSALGGVVNVVSRSGGNEFSGHAFGFFLNNDFSGTSRRAFNAPSTGDFSQYDAGVALGGPIKRDRAWFFAAYNPTVESEDIQIPGLGFHQDKRVSHIFAGKVDWSLGDRTELTFTATGNPGTGEAIGSPETESYQNIDAIMGDVTTGGINLQARGTHFASDRLLLESSVSRVSLRDKQEPISDRGRDEWLFIDNTTGTTSGGLGWQFDASSVQWTAGIEASLSLGRHQVKSGLEYRDSSLDWREDWRYLYRLGDDTYEQVHFLAQDGTVRNRIPSFYLQDSWRITDRLRVNAGARWDGQFLIGSDGKVAQQITDQYQPRVGVVYQMGEAGAHKIFGSAGRFYQELSLAMAVFTYNEFATGTFTQFDHDPRIDPSGGVVGFTAGGTIQPEVDGLEGQHFDEVNLGYERELGSRLTLGTLGTYRTLRQAIESGINPDTGDDGVGNPGRGHMDVFPDVEREYVGIEVIAKLRGGRRYNARASYVLSRSRGNYTGLFDSEYFNWSFANATAAFDLPEMLENGTGNLPNDRTHVFKMSGSYRTRFGLTGGVAFTWQSGTPRSVLEPASFGYPFLNFAQARGSAGRTPSLWDLNLRFAYDLAYLGNLGTRPRLILDIFHLGSQRKAVDYDDVRNFSEDDQGNPTDPNPTYGFATAYQPPTAVRLGVEVGF